MTSTAKRAACASRASTWAGTAASIRRAPPSAPTVNRVETAAEQLALTREYFDRLAAQRPALAA